MTYVDKSVEAMYRSAIGRAIENFGEKAVVENILQTMAAGEEAFRPVTCDLSGFGWYEVDTPDEKISAEEKLKKDPNFN